MSDPQQLASFSPTVRRVISRRVILAAAVAAVCVALANLLVLRNPAQVVLSQSADHSLSPLTKNVLGALTNEVRAVVLFDRQADLFEPVKNLLTEYERQSPRLKLELIDPTRDPARAEDVQEELQLPIRSPENRVIIAADNSAKAINETELSILDLSGFMDTREARRTHFSGERLFTSAIVAVTEDRQTKVGFVTGHGEHKASDTGGQWGYSKLANLLQQKGLLLQEIPIAGTNSIPADCRLLIIAGPRTPHDAGELAKLRDYIGNGGSLFALFNFYSLQRPTGLERFLADYGFEIGVNQVSDSKNEQSGQGGLLLVDDLGSHPITKPILGNRLQLLLPRSVGFPEPEEGDEPPPVTTLAHSSDAGQAVGQIRGNKGTVEREGKIPLIAAKLHTNDGQPPARLVVAGDSLFLGNSAIEAGANRDFAGLAVNWLLEREHLLAIAPRTVTEYRIDLTRAEMTSITWLLLLVLPGGTLGLGLLWWRRQMKQS
ncbi:MAG: GldG family protein [Verrucomicrobia bacterium]|nr:GldG family protein [Verrucomicrobiota bacterium]